MGSALGTSCNRCAVVTDYVAAVCVPISDSKTIFQIRMSGTTGAAAEGSAQPAMFDDSLKCAMCMDLCARPVTVGTALTLGR